MVSSSRISLALPYLIVGRFKSHHLMRNAKRFLRPTRDRSQKRPLENNELINENQSRSCLLERLSCLYMRTYALSTCAHVNMRTINRDRSRWCFARVLPRIHVRTYALNIYMRGYFWCVTSSRTTNWSSSSSALAINCAI